MPRGEQPKHQQRVVRQGQRFAQAPVPALPLACRRWDPGWRVSLADRTVLVLGYGDIGRDIERRLAPFEVDVIRVHVTPGQRVARGDVVVEIESEKANYEIEAEADGTVVEVLVSEGEEAKVGDVVVRIEP